MGNLWGAQVETDGGASTLSPNIGDFTNTPKKGSALTWLNVEKNGLLNTAAFHAVQAHPESAGERITALFQVEVMPGEILAKMALCNHTMEVRGEHAGKYSQLSN